MKKKKGKFYIYGHYTADTDKLFYVGKGTGRRAWAKKANRAKQNPHWANVVNKHGYVVKLIEEGLSEETAFEREKEIIAEIGLENLTNILSGGDGLSSEDAQNLAQDPDWIRKVNEAAQKLAQDPDWIRKVNEAAQKRAKYYGTCISPTGEIYDVYNLAEFCRVHNIDGGNMHEVFRGTRNHHKGWKKYIPPTDIHSEFFTF